jgi:(p)ppGpp synthase/HD superfamily hydrolase
MLHVLLHCTYANAHQIRTTWMDRVASTGVAAGWLGREHKVCICYTFISSVINCLHHTVCFVVYW